MANQKFENRWIFIKIYIVPFIRVVKFKYDYGIPTFKMADTKSQIKNLKIVGFL